MYRIRFQALELFPTLLSAAALPLRCRHSLHAEHGTPQAVIQAIVGHGNPAMTAHYTHIGEDTARRAAGVLDSGIKDAEYEEVRPPLPKWARDMIAKQNSKNWKLIKKELLA